MKIVITLEIDGLPPHVEVKVDEKPMKNLFEGHPEWEKAENDRLIKAFESSTNGKPLGEDISDEKEPPEEIKTIESELTDLPSRIEEVMGDIAITALATHNLKKHRGPGKKFMHIPEPPKKRGRKRKEVLEDNHLQKHPEHNVKTEDTDCPGCQATTNKFIVANSYFPGRIGDAKKAYWEYRKSIVGSGEYLTWSAWLCQEYNKEK